MAVFLEPEERMANGRSSRGAWATLQGNIVLRVLAYYVLLVGAVTVALTILPSEVGQLLTRRDAVFDSGNFFSSSGERAGHLTTMPGMSAAAVAMLSAFLLALPVAWIYVLTRQKKGYRQSVVQTLVILPVVVAGVVILVKSSLALAFSLAGIVAAVRFRNTLEDSKDAVYIFLATGIGLAAGVDLGVAAMLSVLFNAIILLLWHTDFGSSPAALEGSRAERQLQRALAVVNRTGTFVAKMDDEVLKGMSPQQLDALADRAWRRRKRTDADSGEDLERPFYDTLLRVRTSDPAAARAAVEPLIGPHASRWVFGHVIHENDGMHVVEFSVQRRAGVSAEQLADAVRAAGDAVVERVECR